MSTCNWLDLKTQACMSTGWNPNAKYDLIQVMYDIRYLTMYYPMFTDHWIVHWRMEYYSILQCIEDVPSSIERTWNIQRWNKAWLLCQQHPSSLELCHFIHWLFGVLPVHHDLGERKAPFLFKACHSWLLKWLGGVWWRCLFPIRAHRQFIRCHDFGQVKKKNWTCEDWNFSHVSRSGSNFGHAMTEFWLG